MTKTDFTKYPLGTLWLHKPTNVQYRLRRYTDPKTLEGTLYFWCPSTGERIFGLIPGDWELCSMTKRFVENSKPLTRTKQSKPLPRKPTS